MGRAIQHFPANVFELGHIRQFVRETALALGADPEAMHEVVLAVDEAATNIIVHGYRGQPGQIEVEVEPEAEALVITLRDRAPVFDPTGLPSPNLSLPLEERALGGLGVHLMRTIMDEVSHQARPGGGNQLRLMKKSILARKSEGL